MGSLGEAVYGVGDREVFPKVPALLITNNYQFLDRT